MFVSCNENAWATDKIIADWFNKIWFPYLKKENIFNDEVAGLLILDQNQPYDNKYNQYFKIRK